MVVNMALGSYVALNYNCTFYWGKHTSNMGLAFSYRDFALQNELFIEYLDTNCSIQAFAREYPETWARTRETVLRYVWQTYIWGWRTIHQNRLTYWEWTRAALFHMPFIPDFYLRVLQIWLAETFVRILKRLRRLLLRPAATK
jgi:hypothetical protein